MKIEIVVPLWGHWVDYWITNCLPVLRGEAIVLDARIVIYTDHDGCNRFTLTGLADELRPLATGNVGYLDRTDQAHTDAIDRALAGNYAVAPLVAAQLVGAGTIVAAARRLEYGYRAVMALTLPGPMPGGSPIVPAPLLAPWIGQHGGALLWKDRESCAHPGAYGWRAQNGAVLVRPIYISPVLIWPTRTHVPTRAHDHFMTEGYLDTIDQVSFLDPVDGCVVGLPPPVIPEAAGAPAHMTRTPLMKEPDGVAKWMSTVTPWGINIRPWNLHYMWHRFWCGEPGYWRREVEERSDAVVAEIADAYYATEQYRELKRSA